MKNTDIAALIRGFCIELSGKPQIVRCDYESAGPALANAMCVKTQNYDNDENISANIRKTYDSWKNTVINSNSKKDGILLPSCISLELNGEQKARYYIDDDLDSAAKRLLEKNDSPRIAAVSPNRTTIDMAERSCVVKNRIALVTGGAQGIGEEIVRNLAAAGSLVFIADLNLEGAKKLADDINSAENRTAAIALAVNVSDEASVAAMFDAVAETAGGLDLCVSNAGVLKAGSVLEQELGDFKFVTDINYTGFFVICKYAGRLLRTQNLTAPSWKTDIVQINSKSGLEGSNKNGAYAGGKFGGLGLVASYAMELVEYNIKVNAICPGNFLDGPLWSHPEKGLFVQYLNTGKVKGA